MLYEENIKITSRGLVFTDRHGNPLSAAAASRKVAGRVYNWWLDFKLFLVHLISLHMPLYTIRWLVFKLVGLRIGQKSKIHMGTKFFNPAGVEVGADTVIGDRAFLDGRAPLIIGNHVDIASEVMIYNSEHDIEDPEFSATEESVEIGDYAFIGPRAIILPGVKIGRGAVVAAGAVVSDDVKDFEIVGGVPAQKIGERRLKRPKYRLGRTRIFQ